MYIYVHLTNTFPHKHTLTSRSIEVTNFNPQQILNQFLRYIFLLSVFVCMFYFALFSFVFGSFAASAALGVLMYVETYKCMLENLYKFVCIADTLWLFLFFSV